MVDVDIKQHMLSTYVWLRRLMALVTGLFLAVLVYYRVEGGEPPRASISAYYYHNLVDLPMRDVFVATLFAIGLLLIAYQGYTNWENRFLNVGGFALLAVVFFPMDEPTVAGELSNRARVHYVSALVFFGSLAVVSIFFSRRTLEHETSETRKKLFERLYMLTGGLMMCVPVVAIALHYGWKLQSTVFWVEFVGVTAFLLYWVVKSFELQLSRVETVPGVERLEAEAVTAPDAKK